MTPITPKPSAPPVPTQNTTLPPKPAVTVTGGVRVEAAPEKVVEKISTANTVMIYGESRTRKTTQLGLLAEYFYELYGGVIRLITAEEAAGIEPILPYIEAGLIEYIPLNESVADPISLMQALAQGAWYPLVPTPKGQKLTPKERNGLTEGKVSAYFIEGATTISDRILRYLGTSQRKLQQEVAAAFTIESMIEGVSEPEKFGSPGQSHFGYVQTFVTGLFPKFSMLPVREVVWTAHEGRGEDQNTKMQIFGPGLAGKAATSKVPALVGDLFHCQTVIENGKESVKAWIRKHPDDQVSTVLWPAGPRSTSDIAPKLLTRWPEGCIDLSTSSVVDYFKYKRELKTATTDRLRALKEKVDANRNAKD